MKHGDFIKRYHMLITEVESDGGKKGRRQQGGKDVSHRWMSMAEEGLNL